MEGNVERVSVVLATYNRAALLDQCLDGLRTQDFAAGDEVIVADNGSTDFTTGVLNRHQHDFPVPLRVVGETQPGKSHAIAAALNIAQGDICAFIDDDVTVGPGWLAVLREALADGSVGIAGGPVQPRWERCPPPWLASGLAANSEFKAPIALLDYGPSRVPLGERTFLGANLAIRRIVLEQVGGFALDLGKLRGTLRSGEDDDLCRRVQAAGFEAVYEPSALVYHWVPAHRMRLRYFIAWFYWAGVTGVLRSNRMPDPGGRRFAGVPGYLVRQLVSSLAAVPVTALRGRWTDCIGRLFDAAYAAGYSAACWGLPATGSAHGRLSSAYTSRP
jgi:glycosyltransferase involved in cell wall biosynthesis